MIQEEATERHHDVQKNGDTQSDEREGTPSPDVNHSNTDEVLHEPRAKESTLPKNDIPQSDGEAQDRIQSQVGR